MASIDNRIVEMKFDNAAFEKKVATTIDSLDKLQKSLDFPNAAKGFEGINDASRSVSFSGISSGIEGLTAKFSALQVAAITVLANITSRAVDAGLSLVKSLSLEQVMSGFTEYETNMRSIQTILANTRSQGTGLEDVNSALDELNAYADLTIYNFAQMTRNIGTFTAAGVDLDTSVSAIKGIANLAAISGSSSEQASTAMYQLSQAISSGAVKLMDWNSVVNAGMGGRVFQEALFETGKALGTITGVPIDRSFQEWTDSGNSFRESLQDGWITADVLTTTLRGFTGELDEAQLAALGYSEAQAKSILELGETGVEAATKVRTLTALVDTAKESVASGWSASFRIILGDFETATELFSDLSGRFGDFVGASADTRNAILEGWANLGGRQAVIDSLYNALDAFGRIARPIKEAFQDIFPPVTSFRLIVISQALRDFTESLKLNRDQMFIVKDVARGLFAGFEILLTIVKEAAGAFKDVFSALTENVDGGGILDFIRNFANSITDLNEKLVAGGGIADFFDQLVYYILNPAEAIAILREELAKVPGYLQDFGSSIKDALPETAAGILDRLGDGFGRLRGIVESLTGFLDPIINALDTAWGYISDWFGELSGKMSDAAEPGDFSKVLDAVNLGIVASIGAFFAVLTKGINLDFGGIFEGVTDTLENVSGVLQAMQTEIKANAILKIAAAVGILAVSALILASVDSASLAKALTAIAIGLAQLMVGFAAVTKIGGVTGAASFSIAATGLVLLSTAILILAGAVKILSTLSWEELAKGLGASVALITTLAVAVQFFSANSSGMVRAGAGLLLLSIGLNFLATAVKIFATMSWEEIAKGIAGIASGLIVMAAALQLMPWDSLTKSAGLLIVAVSLNVLAGAIKIFATMSWEEIAKGLSAMAGGLLGIALAMNLMPTTLPIIAAGLILVSGAVYIIALAMKEFAGLSWEEMARGLASMAGALLILGTAATLMGNPATLAGAVAIGILSVSLLALAQAMTMLATLSWGDIIKSLILIAGAFVILGGISAILGILSPLILLFGVALVALGAGMLLVGAGALLLATAFKIVSDAGTAGISVLIGLIDKILERVPDLARGLAIAMLEIADIILDALPVIIEQLGVILGHLIDTVIDLIPKMVELMGELIDAIIGLVEDKAPDIIEAGFELLLNFLNGISDNIEEIVDVVADIITKFLSGIADNLEDIIDAGFDVLTSFIDGIADNISDVFDSATDVVTEFISGIGDMAGAVVTAGVDTILAFLEGVASNTIRLASGAADIVIDFLNALSDTIDEKAPEIREAGWNLAKSIIDGITGGLASKVGEVVGGAKDLAGNLLGSVGSFLGINSPSKEFYKIGQHVVDGLSEGLDDSVGAENSATALARRATHKFEESLNMMASSLGMIDEFNPTITPVLDLTQVQKDAKMIGSVVGGASLVTPISSYNQANAIASSDSAFDDGVEAPQRTITEIRFEQNNYSPESLSTADIYRQTRNQISIAKEELNIL